MKVLIIAYACEPGKGSEPGIGWDWVTTLARRPDLEVIVLTRANNRASIEGGIAKLPAGQIPRFVFFDLPWPLAWWKRGHAAVYPYYVLWCLAVRHKLSQLIFRERVDVVHHLTFSTDWLPNGLPLNSSCATVLGPLGGYDTAPEMTRFISNRLQRLDWLKKLFRHIGLKVQSRRLQRTNVVIANNGGFAHTYAALARHARVECLSTQLCATELPSQKSTDKLPQVYVSGEKLLLTAGRLVYWKGCDVVLETLAVLLRRGVRFRGLIVGSGDAHYAADLRGRARELGLLSHVIFRDTMKRSDFLELMSQIDVFLYPTFYGTADSIMMEAVEYGVPIACFPSNGARELLGDDYPYFAMDYTAEALADEVELADKHSSECIAAMRRITRTHNADRKLSRLIELYRLAISRYELESSSMSVRLK